MVSDKTTICPLCGGQLKYLGSVKRFLKQGGGLKTRIYIPRLKCSLCGKEHRSLPQNALPYKQYDARVIKGFVLNEPCTMELKFEDYPSESSISRWKRNQRNILMSEFDVTNK